MVVYKIVDGFIDEHVTCMCIIYEIVMMMMMDVLIDMSMCGDI